MRSLVLAFAVALLVSGCSAFSREYPDKRHFSFSAERTGEPRTPLDSVALKVRPLDVSRSYEGRELVYRQGDLDWATDYYNVLFVPPADLLSDALVVWLVKAELFGQVVPHTSRVDATHYLEGYISSFYGDYSDPDSRRAVVELAFLVIDERDLESTVAYQRTYQREEPLADDSVEELILGFERAVVSIYTELEGGLAVLR